MVVSSGVHFICFHVLSFCFDVLSFCFPFTFHSALICFHSAFICFHSAFILLSCRFHLDYFFALLELNFINLDLEVLLWALNPEFWSNRKSELIGIFWQF